MRKSLNLDALQNSAMVVSMENEEVHPLQRAKSDMVRPVTRRTHRRGSNSDGDGSEMVVPTKIIPLSDHTIRLIEAMDDGQVDNALAAFEEMKTKRRESNLITTARASRRKLKGFDLCDFDVVDDDEDRKTDDVFFQRGGLKKILDSDKPTVVNTMKSESELDPNFTTESAPKRRPPRERRQTLHRSLISTERNDFDLGCEAHSGRLDKPNNCSAEKSSLGLQAFLGKITGAFHHQEDVKPKKQLDGPALFRKGKRKADKCLFLEAVALFNFALEKQRETLGEDHLDCATTLNEIGNAWMILGERYSALTAYEEALYIRQKGLGPGALEVAETTNNIWMILHEQRCEMEEEMNEGNDEYSA